MKQVNGFSYSGISRIKVFQNLLIMNYCLRTTVSQERLGCLVMFSV
jgi:hypothetical protein